MIQLKTVNRRSDPSKYWDENMYRTVDFEDETTGNERTVHVTYAESIEAAIESADYDRFIVDKNPETLYDHPNADVTVRAYDGYNE